MKTTFRKKKKSNWALRIVLVAVVAFLFLKSVQLHAQLEDKQKQLDQMAEETIRRELIIEDLEEQKNNADALLEQKANENGLCHPGQQIYQNAAG
ncbi:MAG: hypothetical protein IJ518_05735 [Clostridia bacterium]|nr:hypothetical protein [Clostridia bacterium]